MVAVAVATSVAPVRREYEFRVSGRLSERARQSVGDFSEMRIVPAPPETILYGAVTDQAHLHGILTFLEGLGLQIVSVHQLPDPTGPAESQTSS
jgi:hypothetical protein